jgi:CRISPR-associated protein Csx10
VRDPLTGQYCEDLAPIFRPQPVAMYRRTRLVGGFNRKWSLPRPQAHVIQAGSVFVYRCNDISPDDLARAAREGIGERRCDGFGHIAVNWQRHATVKITRPARLDQGSLEKLADPEARAVAQMIVDRAQRRRLDQKLIRAVMQYAEGARGRATTSALARVRVEARRAGFNKSDLSGLRRALDDMKNGDRLKAAAKSLNEIRMRDKGLYDWLRELVSPPASNSKDDRLSTLLGDDLNMNLAIGDVKPASVASLTNEYIARFIEGLTHQLIRQEKRAREEA